jgi:hypothetical protein
LPGLVVADFVDIGIHNTVSGFHYASFGYRYINRNTTFWVGLTRTTPDYMGICFTRVFTGSM